MRRLLTATALVLASGTLAQAEGTLQLFNWGNCTSPEMLAKFEAETGIKVTVTDYDSNDAALAKIEAGGHGFDLVVPTHQYVPIFVEKGLIVPLDLSKIPNRGNIAPEWQNVSWDPGRAHTIPWQWGTTGIAVDTAVYGGDINTSDVFLNVPPELVGKINVVPEMNDIVNLAVMWAGGSPCSEDIAVLKKARDALLAAKPNRIAMDCGDSKEDYPVRREPVALPKDARNVEEAWTFLNLIALPENADLISAFVRQANGIAGSDAFMPDDRRLRRKW